MGDHRDSMRGSTGAEAATAADHQVLALAEFLAEEVIVHGRDGSVKQRLGPPSGILGSPARTENLLGGACHPDDLEVLVELAAGALGSTPGWSGTARLRLQHEDGSWRWCESRVWNFYGIDPHDGLVTAVRELFPTDGGRSAEADPSDLMPAVAEAGWVASLLIDRSLVIRHCTPAAARLLGAEPEALVGSALRDVTVEEDLVHLVSGLTGLAPDSERMVVCRFRRHDGSEMVTEVRLLRGGGSPFDLITVVLTDRTDQAALVHLATIDPLTGLANRVRVMEALEGHLAQGTPVTVIYGDVDGLKPLNDALGHAVGDKLLVEMAQRLTAVIGPGPVLGRMGGDEFVAVCHGPHAERAPELAERLRTEISIDTFDTLRPATISAGWAEAAPGESAEDVLQRADAAMYVHKRSLPRNRRATDPDDAARLENE